MTLWNGRFDAPMAAALFELSESYSFDHALYHHDIVGSLAHVRGLEHAGILSSDEATALSGALQKVEQEFAQGLFTRTEGDEDIHMAIERRVTELLGDVGAKLHSGRSRNDQVATTLRLFTRDALTSIANEVLALIDALVEVGEANEVAYLPGYTHTQRAQPVLLSHHLSAHAWALTRDVDRLVDARTRLDVSPLGAGALAGTSLALDPKVSSDALGFREPFANSMDAVSDRDFVAEALFTIALLGIHLSRMGEELVLWTSSEFNFATLGDDFTTGSSMLPQKKNSDVAELSRAKSGRLIGNLTALLVVLKGLPLSYNRDLQEDKEPLFDSVRQIHLVLRAMRGAYRSMTFHDDVAAQAADDSFLVAIDIAERLVAEGVPFRKAHEEVGQLVGRAVAMGVGLNDLVASSADYQRFVDLFAPGSSLRQRSSPGASGPLAAKVQADRLRHTLKELHSRVAS